MEVEEESFTPQAWAVRLLFHTIFTLPTQPLVKNQERLSPECSSRAARGGGEGVLLLFITVGPMKAPERK